MLLNVWENQLLIEGIIVGVVFSNECGVADSRQLHLSSMRILDMLCKVNIKKITCVSVANLTISVIGN